MITDKAGPYLRVLDELVPAAAHLTEQYGNNQIEADHGRLKARLRPIRSWTEPRSRLARDAVLDNLMHYWLPRTGASAARLYWESLSDVSRWLDGPLEDRDLVHAPVGCSIFPYELQQPTRHEAEQRFTDIRYWNEPQIGGHFPAWEQPASFAREIEAFFTPLR